MLRLRDGGRHRGVDRGLRLVDSRGPGRTAAEDLRNRLAFCRCSGCELSISRDRINAETILTLKNRELIYFGF